MRATVKCVTPCFASTIRHETSSSVTAVRRTLLQWRADYQAFQDTLRAIDLRDGDTGRVVSELSDPAEARLTPERLHLLLPFMRDPGVAFARGVDRDPFYEDIPQRLREKPPAITPDTARWPCTPIACAELAALRGPGLEPRLRRVATIAAFMLDPRRLSDSVKGDTALVEFRDLILGVGAMGPASSHPPIPAPGADWHAWQLWMNGAPDTAAATRPSGTPPPARFSDSHQTAAAFTELLTGRDLIAEWRRASEQASSDVERYIFEAMLAGRNAWHPEADSVAAWLTGESKIARARGARGAAVVMAGATGLPDSAIVTALIDRAPSRM